MGIHSAENLSNAASIAANGLTGIIVATINGGVDGYYRTFISCPKGRGDDDSDSYVTVYPNPTDGILYVEIDDPNSGAISSSNTAITYDVRLYNGQGNMLRQQFTQGGTVEFDVSGFPPGMYYLHVYDGVNAMPEVHQVVVER